MEYLHHVFGLEKLAILTNCCNGLCKLERVYTPSSPMDSQQWLRFTQIFNDDFNFLDHILQKREMSVLQRNKT